MKRALNSRAGGHNIIMIGAPGQQSMMAKRLPTILQPLTLHEASKPPKYIPLQENGLQHAVDGTTTVPQPRTTPYPMLP